MQNNSDRPQVSSSKPAKTILVKSNGERREVTRVPLREIFDAQAKQ